MPAACAQDITTGLVAHWAFDESSGSTAFDSSGNGNDGAAVEHAWVSDGRVGGCIELDGFGDYVSVVNSSSLQLNGDITISAWVRSGSIVGPHCIVGHGATGSSVQDTYLYLQFGEWIGGSRFEGEDEDAGEDVDSEDINEWTHIVLVHDGSQWKLYRNNTLEDTNDTSQGAVNVTGGRWAIGAASNLSSHFFQGQIDEVRIYNRALTDNDIAEVYADGWATARMLFVTAGNDPSSDEEDRIAQFEDWGYAVTTIRDSASQSEYNTALAGKDVVYIPEEVGSGSVAYKLRETTVGVVVDEPCLADEFGFSTECATNISSQTALTITDNSHYITSSNSTGALTVFDSAQSVAYLSGTLAPGLIPLGDWTSNPGLAALDTGSTLATTYNSSNTAFGRRVFYGFNGSTDFAELNTNGLSLLRRALEWAGGVGDLSFGLEGHWMFDEGTGSTIADSSGNANNASFNTGTPAWVTGVRGSALEFDGTNDAITDASFDPPARGSVAYWFRSDGPPVSRERPWGLGADYEAWQDTDGLISFDISTDGFQGGFITDRPLDQAGRWYHLVAQYDSDTDEYEIYIDGALHKSGVSTWDITEQAAGQLSFGTRTGSTQRFSGALDDFRIYSRWLSSDEISELYGLVGHWKFDEGAGTTIADSSGDDDASFNTGTPTWVRGVRGSALEFDGTNDAITDNDFDPPATGAVAFWIRRSAPLSVAERPFGAGGDWEARQDGDGTLKFDIGVSPFVGAEVFSTSEETPLEGLWSHVVAQFNAQDDTYEVWVDGQLDSSGVNPRDMVEQPDAPLSFGARTGSTQRFVGALDDFRVYDRWLSHREIAELYGLVGHWKLDETSGSTVADSSGMDNDGVWTGAPAYGSGIEEGAAVLDGTNHIRVPAFQFEPTSASIAAWGNLAGGDTEGAELVSVANYFGLRLDDNPGTTGFVYHGAGWDFSSDPPLSSGRGWRHFALVFDERDDEQRLYVNGQLVDTVPATGPMVWTGLFSTDLSIGAHENLAETTSDFAGSIDDVRVFNRAISVEEIQALLNGNFTLGVRIMSWVEVANP